MTVTTFSYCDSFVSCSQTIIECLKYATTGDQPPNTKGGAFVHDPKVKLLPTAGSKLYPPLTDVELLFRSSNACTQHILHTQLVREREVRGVVKLRFMDVTGNLVVCHRMLASIQKVPNYEGSIVPSLRPSCS